MWSQFFDGYCPESSLDGKKVKMRLNSNDFYESENTGLQIAISYPGIHAVILKFRGRGDFRNTVKHADEVVNGELLSLQSVNGFSYCGDEIFMNEEELINYLDNEVENPGNNNKKIKKTSLKESDFENFWHRLYFDLNEGFIIAAIKRAYRDFNRTIENMPQSEQERDSLRKKWINELKRDIELLLIKEFSMQEEFDKWHENLCNKLANANTELALSVGQAQKWVNMSLKYLFLFGEKYVPGITGNYCFFHIPIDNIIQKALEDKHKITKISGAWSKIATYNEYLNYQKSIRRIFINTIPMDEEFKLFNNSYLGSSAVGVSI